MKEVCLCVCLSVLSVRSILLRSFGPGLSTVAKKPGPLWRSTGDLLQPLHINTGAVPRTPDSGRMTVDRVLGS